MEEETDVYTDYLTCPRLHTRGGGSTSGQVMVSTTMLYHFFYGPSSCPGFPISWKPVTDKAEELEDIKPDEKNLGWCMEQNLLWFTL